jgi:antitoxin (DNA-binding transcriptional repressor) of toxin-antitoxin stability system
MFDHTERDETLVVARHGRPIARIVPERARRHEETDRAIGRAKILGLARGPRAGGSFVRDAGARHAGRARANRARIRPSPRISVFLPER